MKNDRPPNPPGSPPPSEPDPGEPRRKQPKSRASGNKPSQDQPPEGPNTESKGEASTPAERLKGVDISSILNGWKYNPEQINARWIVGDDGEDRIQVRLDLGILQMHTTGRPDGTRPMGFESLLEYYESLLDDSEEEQAAQGEARDGIRGPRDAGGSREEPQTPDAESIGGGGEDDAGAEETEAPADEPQGSAGETSENSGDAAKPSKPGEFQLSPGDCQALREEAVQYYHRYVALMALEDFYGVIRDTTRNLRVLDLCRDYAAEDSDQEFLEQFRPYILMVRARALASQAISNNEPKAALHAIDEALDALKHHFDMGDEPNAYDMSGEVQMLRSMRDSLVPKLPISPMAELRARLAKAIETENYELAAILRDELKHMKE